MAFFSFLGTAIAGALFAGSSLAASVIAGGLAFAAKIGLSYLNRPKKRAYSAVQGETQFGGDVSVGTIYGTAKTKGQRTFYAKWGKGNKFNAEIFVLANGWCDGLEPYVYFYGQKFALTERDIIGNEVAHYGVEGFVAAGGTELFSIRFYDGRPTQRVDQKLVDDTADLGQTWKETSVNAGLAYVVVERRYNSDKFDKGKPDIEFVLRGLREYDPRKDSTVAGGSGPQRLGDPATHVHTHNPAVHRFNYQLGLRALKSGRTLIGEGKTLGQLDLGTYFVAMNVCDTPRLDEKPLYQCSLVVGGEDDHTEILREFDDAMAGYGLNRRGLSGVIPGAPQIPVLEITADDIPADRAKEVQYRKSAFDRYNHMSGQFMSIKSMWNPESLKPIYVNLDVAEDGRIRQVSNDFLQVTDPDIAQYLINIRYRQNRKGGTATLPVSRRVGMKVQEGEWVAWRGRQWMITEWSLDDRFRVTLKLSETGADIYDDENIEPGPIVLPPEVPLNPSLLSTVQNFNVEVGLLSGPDGTEYPTLRFTWTPPDDPSIIAVRFEYFDGTDPTGKIIQKWRCDDPDSGEDETGANIVPGSPYTARATIVTRPDRLKTWTPWVTTAGTTTPVYLPGMLEDIREFVEDANEWIGEGTRDLIEEAHKIAMMPLEQDLQNYKDKQVSSQQIRSATGKITAAYRREILVATGPNSALAQRIEVVEAEIPTLAKASVLNAVVARVTATENSIDSLASQITLINNTLPGKATVTALNALTTRVTATEGNITAIGQSLTSINVSLGTKASTQSVFLLTGRVEDAEGEITAIANAVIGVSAAADNKDVATSRMRFTASSGPSGYAARIGAQARATGKDGWRSASWFLDVPNNPSLPTRFVVLTDQFVVAEGANLKRPLVFQDGVLRLRDVVLQNADIANLNVDWARIKNVKIDSADIGALTVETSNLDFSAVTSWGAGDTGGAISMSGANGAWVNLFTIVLNNPNPNPVWVSVEYTLTAGHIGSAAQTMATSFRLVRPGATVISRTAARANAAGSGTTTVSDLIMLFDPDTGHSGGNRTYTLQGQRSFNGSPGTSTVDVKVTLLTWKR